LFVRLLGKGRKQKKSEINQLEIKVDELNGGRQTQEEIKTPEIKTEYDDLTMISGIGPKISGILADADITTFAQLAGSEESELKSILAGAQIWFVDPGSWIEQAEELL
jgi:predicted flap endonuclease-1-like 5' DNA nuclease